MQPSVDQNGSTPSQGFALRRWGPIVAIVAAVAVVAGFVVMSSGGGDDVADASDTTGGTTSTKPTGEAPAGAISFSHARERGILDEVTFPEACDLDNGTVLIPLSFAPECYANAENNGGATASGVTEETVKIVVYLPAENDIVMAIAMAAVRADDSNAQIRETYLAVVDMYNSVMQTYGRTIEVEFLEGSGHIADEIAARADAVKAMDQMGAFAVWGGPLLAPAWTEEIQARGGVCIDCPGINEPDPNVYSVVASAEQTRVMVVEYVAKKLLGKPAVHAGDETFRGKERVFGHLYLDTGTQDAADGIAQLNEMFDEAGIEIAEQIGYALEPARLAEQAATAIARFQAAGVTTVLLSADPIAPKSLTEVATQQGFFPEWVLAGSALVDTTAFGRTYDPQQWANTFGISVLAARVADGLGDPERLYEWWTGGPPPADEMIKIFYPQPTLFFLGLQAAGPNLTPTTFRDGLFSLGLQEPARTRQVLTFGDHGLWDSVDGPDFNGVDDFVEIWWDPALEGPDEVNNPGTGMVRYVDGGRRYLPGQWTDELRVFDPEGAVSVYEELPEDERPPDIPRPRR